MPLVSRVWVLAAGLASVLAGCTDADGSATAPAPEPLSPSAMTVTVAPVSMRELTQGVDVSGEVAAVEEMLLGVELGGFRVTELRVDVGQSVRRGDVLLRLDDRMLRSDLAQADAALREAQAGASLARANFERGERLLQSSFVSANQLDELRAARIQSEARVGTARAARDSAALRLSFAQLRAPADGIVSRRSVQPGQVVMAGADLLRLIRDGRLEWRAQLPVSQLAAVAPGARVELRAPGGAKIEGRVRAVSPGVDAVSRTGLVYADLPDDAELLVGSFLDGRIDTALVRVPTVPVEAVVLRDGFPTVFTVDQTGLVHAHRVRTGTRGAEAVEVQDGPAPGAHVAVRGAGFLAAGDRVRVVAGAGAGAPAGKPR